MASRAAAHPARRRLAPGSAWHSGRRIRCCSATACCTTSTGRSTHYRKWRRAAPTCSCWKPASPTPVTKGSRSRRKTQRTPPMRSPDGAACPRGAGSTPGSLSCSSMFIMPLTQPAHPQFHLDWRRREPPPGRHRAIFVASRRELVNSVLYRGVPDLQFAELPQLGALADPADYDGGGRAYDFRSVRAECLRILMRLLGSGAPMQRDEVTKWRLNALRQGVACRGDFLKLFNTGQ